MKLYEYEGKELLKKSGVAVPEGKLVKNAEEADSVLTSLGKTAVKAQLLAGKRGKAGAIRLCNNVQEGRQAVTSLLGSMVHGEEVKAVLIEKKLDTKKEYYASIVYDTLTRAPAIVLCKEGGADIEEYKKQNPDKVVIEAVDMADGLSNEKLNGIVSKSGIKNPKISGVIRRLFECFLQFDCRIAEINPLVETAEGDLVAADAKMVIDDEALFRQPELQFYHRSGERHLTAMEIAARQIDKEDHKGTAGSSFLELGGDIAILASGGGASITCMDALIEAGGRPANYTEYSGNPPAEKVQRLTEITLSRKGLHGCWVCGGTANFTDIYETLRGFLEGIRRIRPKYPIVVRRAGPRDEEAFEMLRKAASEEGFDLHVYGRETAMTKTASIMAELARKYEEAQ